MRSSENGIRACGMTLSATCFAAQTGITAYETLRSGRGGSNRCQTIVKSKKWSQHGQSRRICVLPQDEPPSSYGDPAKAYRIPEKWRQVLTLHAAAGRVWVTRVRRSCGGWSLPCERTAREVHDSGSVTYQWLPSVSWEGRGGMPRSPACSTQQRGACRVRCRDWWASRSHQYRSHVSPCPSHTSRAGSEGTGIWGAALASCPPGSGM